MPAHTFVLYKRLLIYRKLHGTKVNSMNVLIEQLEHISAELPCYSLGESAQVTLGSNKVNFALRC